MGAEKFRVCNELYLFVIYIYIRMTLVYLPLRILTTYFGSTCEWE
jgi:hypothetical protein